MSTIWSVTVAKRKIVDGKVKRTTQQKDIEIPNAVSEIKMRQWVDFMLVKEEAPKWFKDVEAADPKLRQELLGSWDNNRWSDFYLLAAQLINSVLKDDLMTLLSLHLVEDENVKAKAGQSLLTIYLTINAMISAYKPERREFFDWKGKRYFFPEDLIETLERKYTGATMSTIEAIEALQIEHVYSARNDETGEFVLEDHKYHTDIALLAALSRKELKGGELEEMPLEFQERRAWMARRVKMFGDVSMDIALDMAFFLLNSKPILNSILRSHTSLIASLTT